MTEIKFALKPTPEPFKIHHNENSLSHQVIINGLVKKKGTFSSSFGADNSKLQNVFYHMDETTLKIDSTCKLGQPKGDKSKPRPLLVRFTSERDARKCLSKSYQLKTITENMSSYHNH